MAATKAAPKSDSTHEAAYALVKQIGTAFSFAVGDFVTWNLSQLQLYCLCMTPGSPGRAHSIISRNHVDVSLRRVRAAYERLAELELVDREEDHIYSDGDMDFRLAPKGEQLLKVIAGNLSSDLQSVGKKEVTGLEALAQTYDEELV